MFVIKGSFARGDQVAPGTEEANFTRQSATELFNKWVNEGGGPGGFTRDELIAQFDLQREALGVPPLAPYLK